MNEWLRPAARTAVVLWIVSQLVAADAQTADDFFDPRGLYRMDLLVNSRDWNKLKAEFQLDDYYPADLRWEGVTVRNVGIRSRGRASRSGTKPGLRVDANRYTSRQTFLDRKSFTLDNLTQDPTGVREHVAMRFVERMGLPAPREVYVQLYVNNEYAGLYTAVEAIDKDFLGRVFGTNSTGIEDDGYLFDYRYSFEWYFTYPGPTLDFYQALFRPVTHENESPTDLYSPFEAMFRAINEASDAAFTTAVGAYLDLPLFMKHVAVQNFLAEFDGILGVAGVNNFYLYRFENSTRSQFIAWDEDQSFFDAGYPVLQGHAENVLMRRAMQAPELRAAYFDALLAAAASASEIVGDNGRSWLEEEIVQRHSRIGASMHADPLKPFSNEQFDAGIEVLLAFARSRTDFVRCEVAKIIDPGAAAAACTGMQGGLRNALARAPSVPRTH